jgi:hypothetical protein
VTVGRINKPKVKGANLPQTTQDEHAPKRREVEPEDVFRGLLLSILRDPVSSPADKIRAMTTYQQLAPKTPPRLDEQLAVLPERELNVELEPWVVDVLRAVWRGEEILGVDPEHFPQVRTFLQGEFTRAVEERVRERVDPERRREEIDERARELARELYRARAFEAVPVEAAAAPVARASSRPDPARGWASRRNMHTG